MLLLRRQKCNKIYLRFKIIIILRLYMKTSSEQSVLSLMKSWLRIFFPNSQAVSLAIILIVGFLLIYFLSEYLAPVFAAVVLAYLLEGLIQKVEARRLARMPSVFLVFSGFIAFLGYILFVLMPMIYQQTIELSQRVPAIIGRVQTEIMRLPEIYPNYITEYQISEITISIQEELIKYGQDLLSVSATSVIGLVTAIIYLILVPVLIFFFLQDKHKIMGWLAHFLPSDTVLSTQVWKEVDMQMGNYVRGKFVEVFLLWAVSYITFSIMDLNYAMLLAVFVGLSVIIPYIGATLVTFPVLGVAFFQWGMGADFIYLTISYMIMQSIDGMMLVPLLFSEVVNLHPIAIIVAILFFGGIWGFWGVFFAIPLATLVRAVIAVWPKIGERQVDVIY